jgi:hypothetical protein
MAKNHLVSVDKLQRLVSGVKERHGIEIKVDLKPFWGSTIWFASYGRTLVGFGETAEEAIQDLTSKLPLPVTLSLA